MVGGSEKSLVILADVSVCVVPGASGPRGGRAPIVASVLVRERSAVQHPRG